MTTVTRNQFNARFEGKSIDLQSANLTNVQRTALQRADANGDGKLEGTSEINTAFTKLDDFDRNGSRNSVNAGTTARPSAVGTAINNLERAATAAPRRGLSGNTGAGSVNNNGSGSSVPNGTAQIDRTSNTGQRNQLATGRVTINGNTYDFRSGGYGKGNLPKGTYDITRHMDSRSDRAMSVGGVGYSFAMSDKYDSRVGATRTLLRIHPDGGSAGTLGCLGIVGDAATQRRFRADMLAEIQRNGGTFRLTVQ
ncbi:MAG TPA: hypothetical protein VGF99_20580 [Myxococcota bacterium]